MSNYLKKLAYISNELEKIAMEKQALGGRWQARRQARIANGGWYPGKFMGRPAPVTQMGYQQPSASAPVQLPVQSPAQSTTDPNGPITTAVPSGPTPSQRALVRNLGARNTQNSTPRLTKPSGYPGDSLRQKSVSNPASVVKPVIDPKNNITAKQWKNIDAYQKELISRMVRHYGITPTEAKKRLIRNGRYYERNGVYSGKRFNDIASGRRTSKDIQLGSTGSGYPIQSSAETDSAYNPYLEKGYGYYGTEGPSRVFDFSVINAGGPETPETPPTLSGPQYSILEPATAAEDYNILPPPPLD